MSSWCCWWRGRAAFGFYDGCSSRRKNSARAIAAASAPTAAAAAAAAAAAVLRVLLLLLLRLLRLLRLRLLLLLLLRLLRLLLLRLRLLLLQQLRFFCGSCGFFFFFLLLRAAAGAAGAAAAAVSFAPAWLFTVGFATSLHRLSQVVLALHHLTQQGKRTFRHSVSTLPIRTLRHVEAHLKSSRTLAHKGGGGCGSTRELSWPAGCIQNWGEDQTPWLRRVLRF